MVSLIGYKEERIRWKFEIEQEKEKMIIKHIYI
jgi:hypothetical protein